MSHLTKPHPHRGFTIYCGLIQKQPGKWNVDHVVGEFDQTVKCWKCTRMRDDGEQGVLFDGD